MGNVYANLHACTNYLIQLFYKTNKRYSCTQTKIGKLLSILAFKYAVQDEKLFYEDIYRYPPNCGTIIDGVQGYIEREVYFRYPYYNSKESISANELNENVDIPKKYNKYVSSLSLELKKDIEDVFFNFGAYSTSDLSEVLNPIVEYVGICRPDGRVDLNNIILLYNKLPGNKVLDYIFNR